MEQQSELPGMGEPPVPAYLQEAYETAVRDAEFTIREHLKYLYPKGMTLFIKQAFLDEFRLLEMGFYGKNVDVNELDESFRQLEDVDSEEYVTKAIALLKKGVLPAITKHNDIFAKSSRTVRFRALRREGRSELYEGMFITAVEHGLEIELHLGEYNLRGVDDSKRLRAAVIAIDWVKHDLGQIAQLMEKRGIKPDRISATSYLMPKLRATLAAWDFVIDEEPVPSAELPEILQYCRYPVYRASIGAEDFLRRFLA